MNPRTKQNLAWVMLWAAGLISIFVLSVIVIYVLAHGYRSIDLDFLTTNPKGGLSGEGGILSTVVSTVYIVLLTVLFTAPFGIGAAIYLAEYARDNWITRLARYGTDVLAGVPSIVFGLFGFAVFVTVLRLSFSILSGALTLACLCLPTLIRTAEEAIKAVPRSYREAGLALGATRWQTIVTIVIPAALPGIITGIILIIGRAVGETACLYVTMGGSAAMPQTVLSGGRTLALHLYYLAMDTRAIEKAMATGVVLIIIIFLINMATKWLSNRFYTRMGGIR